MKRILIINPFGIGDVLFTTPFIDNIKVNIPDAYIGYIGNTRTSSFLKNNPNINKVFVYDRDKFKDVYKQSKIQYVHKTRSFLRDIKHEQFDVVFDFSLQTAFSILTWFVGIKQRIGLNYKKRSKFLTKPIPFDGFKNKHVVEHYLEILTDLGLNIECRELNMATTEEDDQWAERFLKENGILKGDSLVGVMPGAGASWGEESRYRRWSPLKYAKLVDKIIEKYGAKIILMGDQKEAQLCSHVAEQSRSSVIQAFGRTTIGQLAALLSQCQLVVMNDGGPLHIAVAVKTRTVSIFGPVDDQVYGPYGCEDNHTVVKADIACQPCYRQFRMTQCEHISCLERITVDDVFERVEEILKNDTSHITRRI